MISCYRILELIVHKYGPGIRRASLVDPCYNVEASSGVLSCEAVDHGIGPPSSRCRVVVSVLRSAIDSTIAHVLS